MTYKAMTVSLVAIAAIVGMVWFMVNASIQNTQTRAEAVIIKSKEQTKRAEGRHELMDILGLLRK